MRRHEISVVVPLFNKAAHVGRAIVSVLSQSFRDFEIVVVDDGSTDGGADAVRAIADPRIRLVSQANAGASSARNRGIREARHELIAFLDADDSYNPDFLAVILELAARHETAGAFGTSFEIVRPDGRAGVWRTPSLRGSGAREVLIRDFFAAALSGPVLWSSAAAVPKSTFDAVGLFPDGVVLGEDLDMWMRIGAAFPVAVSGYVGAVYRQDAANRVDDGRLRGVEYELVRTGARLLSSLRLDRARRAHLREYVAMYQIITANELVRLGFRARAREILRECRTTRFFLRRAWWLFWAFLPTRVTLAAQRVKRALSAPRARPAA